MLQRTSFDQTAKLDILILCMLHELLGASNACGGVQVLLTEHLFQFDRKVQHTEQKKEVALTMEVEMVELTTTAHPMTLSEKIA